MNWWFSNVSGTACQHRCVERPVRPVLPDYLSVSCDYDLTNYWLICSLSRLNIGFFISSFQEKKCFFQLRHYYRTLILTRSDSSSSAFSKETIFWVFCLVLAKYYTLCGWNNFSEQTNTWICYRTLPWLIRMFGKFWKGRF